MVGQWRDQRGSGAGKGATAPARIARMTVTASTSKARALIAPLLLCFALSLIAVGCVTLTGHDKSCSTSTRFGSVTKMTCAGTIDTVRGEGPLTFDESQDDEDDEAEYSGEYRLEMIASVEHGSMDIYTEEAKGGPEGGEVSPGSPLKIEAVGPFEGSVAVKVKGGEEAEVNGLKYEVTIAQVS
jgi:hypothetical protein